MTDTLQLVPSRTSIERACLLNQASSSNRIVESSFRTKGLTPIVSFARTEEDMEAVYRLTHDRYVDMGYAAPLPNRRLIHFPQLDGIPETYVILVRSADVLMGTVTLTLDGPNGLHVDEDFKAQVDLIRRSSGRLASSWRIVTREDPAVRKTVMTLIGNVVYLAFNILKCQTFLNTFNPRHERIYRKLLNMETIGHSSSTDTLTNAPAVLMRCDARRCPKRWLRKSDLFNDQPLIPA